MLIQSHQTTINACVCLPNMGLPCKSCLSMYILLLQNPNNWNMSQINVEWCSRHFISWRIANQPNEELHTLSTHRSPLHGATQTSAQGALPASPTETKRLATHTHIGKKFMIQPHKCQIHGREPRNNTLRWTQNHSSTWNLDYLRAQWQGKQWHGDIIVSGQLTRSTNTHKGLPTHK